MFNGTNVLFPCKSVLMCIALKCMNFIYRKFLVLLLATLFFDFAFGQDLVWKKEFGNVLQEETALGIATDACGNLHTVGFFETDMAISNDTVKRLGNRTFLLLKTDTFGVTRNIITGGGDYNNVIGYDVVCDNACNTYVVGSWFGGPANLQKPVFIEGNELIGSRGIFVLKVNAADSIEWINTFSGEPGIYGDLAIALDNNNNVIVNANYRDSFFLGGNNLFRSDNKSLDICLVKFSKAGEFLWAKSYGGSGEDSGGGVDCDENGNIYITGSFENSIKIGNLNPISAEGFKGFTAQIDSNGNATWLNLAPYTEYNTRALASTIEGNSYRGGQTGRTAYLEKVDFFGNNVWSVPFTTESNFSCQISDININSSGQVLVTGYFYGDITVENKKLNPGGFYALFIAVISANGKLVWINYYDKPYADKGLGVVGGMKGNAIYVCGNGGEVRATGSSDFLIGKYSNSKTTSVRPIISTNQQIKMYYDDVNKVL